jgi:hypothetical protein
VSEALWRSSDTAGHFARPNARLARETVQSV